MAENTPVIMDLPDFVPEEYEFSLNINRRAYRFRYAEARVDEVYRMMAGRAAQNLVDERRSAVVTFLTNNLVEGDGAQLRKDLDLLAYISPSGQLDIDKLFNKITVQVRVKKNGPGESPEAT